ncbi:hypothetical protein SDC9_77255 [bioreactor metagenome]|uniref:Uncharacterized protein n=1 Tax=bioreactor metagenome TaxID=1076179 RepID=A0A644YQ40_9ZZZZ
MGSEKYRRTGQIMGQKQAFSPGGQGVDKAHGPGSGEIGKQRHCKQAPEAHAHGQRSAGDHVCHLAHGIGLHIRGVSPASMPKQL